MASNTDDATGLAAFVEDYVLRNCDGGTYPDNLSIALDGIRAYFASRPTPLAPASEDARLVERIDATLRQPHAVTGTSNYVRAPRGLLCDLRARLAQPPAEPEE